MPKNKHTILKELPATGKLRWNQLAPFMPVSRETFRKLAIEGKAPPPIRYSLRCTLFDVSECKKWLDDPINYKSDAPVNLDAVNRFNLAWAERGGVVKVKHKNETILCKLIEIDAGSIFLVPAKNSDLHIWVDTKTLQSTDQKIKIIGMATKTECDQNEIKYIKNR